MAVSSMDELEARVVAWAEVRPDTKHLPRGEVWAAETIACDGRMKDVLLRMIEWQARATHGPPYDTRSGGRHLEEWAGPGVVEAPRSTFAHDDEDDLCRATFTTRDAFRSVATDTAARLGVAHPTGSDARVSAWLAVCEAGRRA